MQARGRCANVIAALLLQARERFSPADREYIATLDSDRDLALLADADIPLRAACRRILRACTLVLQAVAARDLPPVAAADILERRTLRKSRMEKLHRCAASRVVLKLIRVKKFWDVIPENIRSLTWNLDSWFRAVPVWCLPIIFCRERRLACERACREEADEHARTIACHGAGDSAAAASVSTSPPFGGSTPPLQRPPFGERDSEPSSDEVYLRHLAGLLDEYLDSIMEAAHERDAATAAAAAAAASDAGAQEAAASTRLDGCRALNLTPSSLIAGLSAPVGAATKLGACQVHSLTEA